MKNLLAREGVIDSVVALVAVEMEVVVLQKQVLAGQPSYLHIGPAPHSDNRA